MGKKLIIMTIAAVMASISFAENIDPYEDGSQYAYGENVGWLNFEPSTGDGVQVASDKLTGYVWAENIGWVSMSCENTSSCGTVSYGVTNDGNGNLSGYAWSENVGWISFSCDNTSSCATVDYGVTIDVQGRFDGWAWAENIGWIHFQSASPIAYKVQACKVSFEDFANFAAKWLDAGCNAGNNWCDGADLDSLGDVDLEDVRIVADYWLGFCPDGWQLK